MKLSTSLKNKLFIFKKKFLMKTYLLPIFLSLFISINTNASLTNYEYSSIEEVKELNYQLFTDVGFDENKINFISRVIYANYKRAKTMAENGVSPQSADQLLDEIAKERLTRLLTKDEFLTFTKIKHKIK
tara:strand:+ start:689 stop:1078 length:390 start_codon:yes stop_codon:yes gene_type:complete